MSVLPALVAFASFHAIPSMMMGGTLLIQVAGFNMLYVFDFLASRRRLAPVWYNELRFYLTALVSGSMLSLVFLGWKRECYGEEES